MISPGGLEGNRESVVYEYKGNLCGENHKSGLHLWPTFMVYIYDFLSSDSTREKWRGTSTLIRDSLALECRSQTADRHDSNQHEGPLRSYQPGIVSAWISPQPVSVQKSQYKERQTKPVQQKLRGTLDLKNQ